MTDQQVELARERTRAAWLRTALAFLVALVAVRHYSRDDIFTPILLNAGVFTSSLQASRLSASTADKVFCAALAISPLIALVAY